MAFNMFVRLQIIEKTLHFLICNKLSKTQESKIFTSATAQCVWVKMLIGHVVYNYINVLTDIFDVSTSELFLS